MARFSVDLGYIYELSNEAEKAKKEYEKAIKDLPAEQYQITDLASAFNVRRHPDLAIETYRQGRKLLGNPYIFSIEIAQMYQTSGKIDLMMEEYLQLIEQNPTNAEDIEYRIQSVFADDNKRENYEIVRKSILKRAQKQPDNMGYAVLLYWLSLQQHDLEMSFIQAKSIDKRFTKTNQMVYGFAKVATENNQWNYAIKAYQHIVDQGSNADMYFTCRLELLNAKYQEILVTYPPNISNIAEIDKQFTSLIREFDFNPQMASFIRTQGID